MSSTIDPPKSGSGWRSECLKRVGSWFEYKEGEDQWVKEMKGSLSLTASIIATMAFQLATNPPGGVVQAGLNDVRCSNSTGVYMCAGEAVSAVIHKGTYLSFLVCNTISFIASLGVCLLLVSGIPLDHKFPIWLLSVGMCVTVTSLALTYLFAASMVTPTSIWPSVVGNGFGVVMVVWASLAVIVSGFHIVRFLVRRVIKGKPLIACSNQNHATSPSCFNLSQ